MLSILVISLLVTACHAFFYDVAAPAMRPASSIQLPLERRRRTPSPRRHTRRSGGTTAIGLGDVLDVTYNVLVQVGNTETPLVLDTGSSDLWLVSDSCTPNCNKVPDTPFYSQRSLNPTGLDVHLLYGDSRTETHASGPIGTDTAGIAGLSVSDQSFAAITDTNTTVLETGSAGILGLGFPPISIIWRQRLEAQLGIPSTPSSKQAVAPRSNTPNETSPPADGLSLGRPPFPSFKFLEPRSLHERQIASSLALPPSSAAIASFAAYGPLLTRLITQKALAMPLVATTLQRDTIAVGGNAGQLSLGGLPSGIQDHALTWVPVRAYSVAEGGFPPSPDAPNEVYPLVWEIPIDDVYFDGMKLPRSALSSSSISLSGLLDTGNSLIRGPEDIVTSILAKLGGPSGAFDCAVPHNLSFQIGNALFPVDPRDFALAPSSNSPGDLTHCTPALAATDPPGRGDFLYSWSLGDPFLKSALVAFYYGNLTHPSQDPPRVGLLSTVPANAQDALVDAVRAAADGGGMLPATSDPAPSGVSAATTMGVGGVPQATYPGFGGDSQSSGASRAARTAYADFWGSLALVSVTVIALVGLLQI